LEDVNKLRDSIRKLQFVPWKEGKKFFECSDLDAGNDMKKLSLRLFNIAIQMSHKSFSVELNVQFRSFACDCISLALVALENVDPDEETWSLAINFYSRTGKVWSDMGKFFEAGTIFSLPRFTSTESCFTTAFEYSEKVKTLFPFPSEKQLTKRRKTMLSLCCWRASTVRTKKIATY
jgi:hypothetical protein